MSTHSLRDLISLSLLPAKPLKFSLKRSTNRASRDAYMAMYSSNSMRASRWRSGDMGNFLLKAGSGGMGGSRRSHGSPGRNALLHRARSASLLHKKQALQQM